jgi:hypothetical protein
LTTHVNEGGKDTKECTQKTALTNITFKLFKAQLHAGMNIHTDLALHTLLGSESWTIKDKTRITATEIKFMWRKAKNTLGYTIK